MSSVEDKIKDLLEASLEEAKAETMQKVEGEVEDLGKAVVDPEEKKGAENAKKAKKASAPGGEAEKGDQKPETVKEEDESDEDLISEEEIEEAKKVAEEEDEEMEDESDEDESEEDDEMEEMKKKLHAQVDKMKEMKHMKASYNYVKSNYNVESTEDADLGALIESDDLSDEFKSKAKTVFEAAVGAKIADEIVKMEEHYSNQIDEETNRVRDELVEKVDTYLSYVVEQWTADNELAIERGLKNEITEDFIVSLKQVFEEHYIDVPEDKYDVIAEQSAKIDELEAKLNEQIETNAKVVKSISEAKRSEKVTEFAKDLAETQQEKFRSLVENIAFENDEQFEKELEVIKENYFPKVANVIEEDTVASDPAEEVNLTGEMKDYVSAISRTFKAN